MLLVVDLIARIRNAYMARKTELTAPFSKTSGEVLAVMVREGFLLGFREEDMGKKKFFTIKLKASSKAPVLQEIEAISTPGRKVYATCEDLIQRKTKYSGMALFIVSTTKGILADHEAIAMSLGGKLICRMM